MQLPWELFIPLISLLAGFVLVGAAVYLLGKRYGWPW